MSFLRHSHDADDILVMFMLMITSYNVDEIQNYVDDHIMLMTFILCSILNMNMSAMSHRLFRSQPVLAQATYLLQY